MALKDNTTLLQEVLNALLELTGGARSSTAWTGMESGEMTLSDGNALSVPVCSQKSCFLLWPKSIPEAVETGTAGCGLILAVAGQGQIRALLTQATQEEQPRTGTSAWYGSGQEQSGTVTFAETSICVAPGQEGWSSGEYCWCAW